MVANSCDQIDLNQIFSVSKDGEYTILHYKKPVNKLIVYDPGLYHTAICKSKLCKIDKKDGKLYYRGISVEEKLERDFLDVAQEILFGTLKHNNDFKKFIGIHFKLLPEQKALLDVIPFSTHPMDVLAVAITTLGGLEEKYLQDPIGIVEKTAFLIAQTAISVSYRYCKMKNQPWVESKKDLKYSEKILFQMHSGNNPDRLKKLGKILNMIMILHAEHGQNCSAATVRNVASARGNIFTATASGMASFNGVIHGGASQFVSAMYDELLERGLDIDSYVDEKIEKKELLMGFGQRTYNRIENCWDPRVEKMYNVLMDKDFDFPEVADYKNIAVKLIQRVTNDKFYKNRNLTPNPDLFNCIFYKLFGVPKEMNTVMLALGRIVGWAANYLEHRTNNYPLTRPCDISV